MNLDDNLSKLKFAFITINYHPTDIESFNIYLTTIFLPYIKQSEIYNLSTEYDDTAQRHLHCVLGYTNDFATSLDKIRQYLSGKKRLAPLHKIYNTNENAFQFDYISKDDTFDVYKTIGYCFKSAPENYYSNMSQSDIDACYKAYLYSESKPIAPINHNIEHKQISKGNLLAYLYDSYKKSDLEPYELPVLEAYMIQYHKLSFINISDKQKIQGLKELKLRISENPTAYQDYKTDGFENLYSENPDDIEEEFNQYFNPKQEMIKQILYLRNKVQYLEKHREN